MNSVETDLVYGIIGVFLFTFRNADKKYIYPVSIFTIGLFISQVAYFYFAALAGQLIWAISAIGLLSCYAVRFNNKRQKGIIEFFKLFGIILLTIYPLPFYSLVHLGDGNFWMVTRMVTFFILVTIYLYDRWILKPEEIKRKYILLLVAQSILVFVMLVFSLLQKAQADESRELAEQQREKAIENGKRATEIAARYEQLVKENAALRSSR
jgi:hypothetical protein